MRFFRPCLLLLLILILARSLPGGDEPWWSLGPLRSADIPPSASPWVRTAIDSFILRRLEAEGLEPSKEADRRTLIRRLSFNLLGLPPTVPEIAAFLADRSPDAYEKLVSRLLDSPRYGERWGRHWLDVVHFGESHGYDKDKLRQNSWPFRDYVIRSLNGDKSYVDFVREQIAGDLLHPESPDGVVATGFIAAGPWDFVGHVELREGTVDKEITRSLDRDDMVAVAMSTFTSLTANCARCHDHKFDPISQRDYYRLQAVFAAVDRGDRTYRSERGARNLADLVVQRTKVEGRIEDVLSKIDAAEPRLARIEAHLEKVQKDIDARGKHDGSPSNGYHSAIMKTPNHEKWVQVDLGASRRMDSLRVFPARPIDFRDTPGFGFPASFRIEGSNEADFKKLVLIVKSGGDFRHPGDRSLSYRIPPDTSVRYVRFTAERLWERTRDYIFALGEMQIFLDGNNIAAGKKVTARDSIESGRWSTKHLVDGFDSRMPIDGEAVRKKISLAREFRTLVDARSRLRAKNVPVELLEERDRLHGELRNLRAAIAKLGVGSKVYSVVSRKPRDIYILNRGDVRAPAERVEPGGLAIFGEINRHFDKSGVDPRVAFANWLTDRANPLLWRSIVNRVWYYHFGRGIVNTPNDFGKMGELPSHPELLDWLAVRFRDGGASIKELHRLILTSAVYRQSSVHRDEAAAKDASNRYLWRMNRRRLEAEALRDSVLFATGRIDLRMGGPSVRQFGFKDDHSPHYDYSAFDVDSAAGARRSVYRHIVRSVPDPFMECLDFADPSLLTAKRSTTLTALQALALLNNRLMVRQAEHLAARLEAGESRVEDRIERAYLRALSRKPSAEESRLWSEHIAKYGTANFCRLLFNLSEFNFVD